MRRAPPPQPSPARAGEGVQRRKRRYASYLGNVYPETGLWIEAFQHRRCAPSPACGGGPGWGRHSGIADFVRRLHSLRLRRRLKPQATAYASGTPTPTLPRKRERERSGASVNMIVARRRPTSSLDQLFHVKRLLSRRGRFVSRETSFGPRDPAIEART